MRRVLSLVAALLAAGTPAAAAPRPLVPAPREVKWSAEPPLELPEGATVIATGANAAEPEREAARMLGEFVARRFGRELPVVDAAALPANARVVIALGRPVNNPWVAAWCRDERVDPGTNGPGADGYLIGAGRDGERHVLCVAGADPRGVAYGQDTLAQMLATEGGRLVWHRGRVSDAPVVPWRGRPQTQVKHYLRPGELDLYVTSRVNFIDLRGGIYAFEPGDKLDAEEIRAAVTAAHRRGLVVFATVNCGIPRSAHAAALGTFRELLALGADGVWLSFDDKGPGEAPAELIPQVLRLGRELGRGGHVAITPPKGSYPKVTTDFNARTMAIPGMERALWFWTAPPAPELLAEARALGLRGKPGWWHNWPRLFTAHTYTGIPPMSLGWSAPDDALLAAGGESLDAVMPWGGNALGQWHVVPVIGWWGWNPARHDWEATRRRIAGAVFGEERAEMALRFDDRLRDLFSRFTYSYKDGEGLPLAPPRVRSEADRATAGKLITELGTLLEQLASPGATGSLLAPEEREQAYLRPMRREWETHRATATLRFPEDWWPGHQRALLSALRAGDDARADALASEGRARAGQQIDAASAALAGFPKIEGYLAWWRRRAALDAAGWRTLLAERQKALEARIKDYGRLADPARMLAGLKAPPLEWGIGRWQVANRLLATALPEPREQFWGDWLAGRHPQPGAEAVVFAASRKTPGQLGEFAELPASLPVSGRRDRLGVLLFVSAVNKDLFSNTLVPFRWAGYRALTLSWRGRVLWETDVGAVPETGGWHLVRLPRIPDDVPALELTLRVEDRRTSLNNYTVVCTGPLRLLELPGEEPGW